MSNEPVPPQGNPLKITVSLDANDKVQVDPPDAVASMGSQPVLMWQPSTNLTIEYVGFNDPVGSGRAIEAPKPETTRGPGRPWVAVDKNPQKETFVYNIWVSMNGVTYSSDPQIINEGQGGGTEGGTGG